MLITTIHLFALAIIIILCVLCGVALQMDVDEESWR